MAIQHMCPRCFETVEGEPKIPVPEMCLTCKMDIIKAEARYYASIESDRLDTFKPTIYESSVYEPDIDEAME
jgi:hypothetical protein